MIQVRMMIPIAEIGRRRRTGEECSAESRAANVECTLGVRVRCIEMSSGAARRQPKVSDSHLRPATVRSAYPIRTIRHDRIARSRVSSGAVVQRRSGAYAIRHTMRGLLWAIVFEGAAATCLYAVWHVWRSSR
jgi:hypothetical protein